MGVEIQVVFDGDVNGLAEHRLSLSEFAPIFERLTSGLRREVSCYFTGEESTTGRLHEAARNFDLELSQLVVGSCGLRAQCVLRNSQQQLNLIDGDEVVRVITERFFDSVVKAVRGERVQNWVSSFMQVIPNGVTTHSYCIYQDGQEVYHTEVTGRGTSESNTSASGVRIFCGRVDGVRLISRSVVYLLDDDGKSVTAAASETLVKSALGMGQERVRVAISLESPNRLIWIRPFSEKTEVLDEESLTRKLLERWDHVLEELAK